MKNEKPFADMKILLIFISILLSFAFVIGCQRADNQVTDQATNNQAVNSQPTNNQTAIDGLFGIKLGEPLPASCTNSWTSLTEPDEWGFQVIAGIVPPNPNSEFTNFFCSVTLTPTSHLVCEIDIQEENLNDSVYDGLRDALRHRYGQEDESKSFIAKDDENDAWSINRRSLSFSCVLADSTGIYTTYLNCKDDVLAAHPAHVTDTNGL